MFPKKAATFCKLSVYLTEAAGLFAYSSVCSNCKKGREVKEQTLISEIKWMKEVSEVGKLEKGERGHSRVLA